MVVPRLFIPTLIREVSQLNSRIADLVGPELWGSESSEDRPLPHRLGTRTARELLRFTMSRRTDVAPLAYLPYFCFTAEKA